jgi:hypothetical protein
LTGGENHPDNNPVGGGGFLTVGCNCGRSKKPAIPMESWKGSSGDFSARHRGKQVSPEKIY